MGLEIVVVLVRHSVGVTGKDRVVRANISPQLNAGGTRHSKYIGAHTHGHTSRHRHAYAHRETPQIPSTLFRLDLSGPLDITRSAHA